MIVLIPVTLLFIAVILQILGRTRFTAGRTWLISSIVATAAWVSMILMRLLMPSGLEIPNWLPGELSSDVISFQLTENNWVLGFLLVSLMVSIIFYEARSLENKDYVNILTGTLALIAFGLLSVFSGSGLTFLLTWVMIDIAEFAILAGIIKDEAKHQIAVTSILTRSLGIILFLAVLILQNQDSTFTSIEEKSSVFGVLIVIAAVLRMGIVPIHIPYSEDPRIRRGIGSILRFVPILSVFSFLSFYGPQTFNVLQYNWLIALFSIAAVFGSISWYLSKNKLVGRPYWIFTLGSLAIVGFLRSAIEGVIAIAVLMVAGGMGLFLYSSRSRKYQVFLLLILLSMLAIPYTPTAALSQAVWGDHLEGASIFLFASVLLLICGWINHSREKDEELTRYEDWVWLFHIMALIVMVITPWISEIFYLETVANFRFWWFSAALVIMAGVVLVIKYFGQREGNRVSVIYSRIQKGVTPFLLGIDRFFRFNWFIRIVQGFGSLIAVTMNILVRVLEGDGGILWSFLFLVLLVSILMTGQVP